MERRRMEDDVARCDSLGNVDLLEAGYEQVRPRALPEHSHKRVEDEEAEDSGLRNLFEDPEFPPGFEPVRGLSDPVVDTDEAYVQEEALQTLNLAKKLGCGIPDESLTMDNLAGIIREQRETYRRMQQDASGGEKGDSDRCSRNSSKGGSRRTTRSWHA